MENILVNFFLPLGIGLTLLGFLSIVVMSLYQVVKGLMSDPTGTIKGLAGVLILIVVLLIIWQISPSEKTGFLAKSKYDYVTPGALKFVGAGITSIVVMLVVGFVSLIAAEIYNLFK
ncbi:MAG: hypothetical protein IPM47_17120 [Sphingobacteriales bacterium]|nr:MAG: hypothetical protein IPM47_17120 [Sphingobacteriales bacterium]